MRMRTTARPPLDGGTALVTGASSGIGRELAIQVAARVGTLILLARRTDRLQQLRAELVSRHSRLNVLALPVDLANEDDVARVLSQVRDQIGTVDVLINAA